MRRVLAVGLGLSLFPGWSFANGRFPAAGQLVVDPGNDDHIVTRTTYGLITTSDGGQNWDWICETAVGYSSTTPVDPAIAVTSDGSLLAGFGTGLSVGVAGGCDWQLEGDALSGQDVVDVSVEKGNPANAVAIVSTALGGGSYRTQLFESLDNALTWNQAGLDLPSDLAAETLDVAPSDHSTVYVSGLSGENTAVLARSRDRGATWELRELVWETSDGTDSGDADHLPFIAGIDPFSPDTLYVRLSGTPGRLLATDDGGDHWTLLFEGAGSLKGFALSPDGSQLLVGGDGDGTWRASTVSRVFEKVSTVRPQCLTWVDGRVYACALEYNDGFTLGISEDDGATWTPFQYQACVRGPLACPEGSSVNPSCLDAWPATSELIDQASCPLFQETPAPTPTPAAEPSPSPTPSDDAGEGSCSCDTGSSRAHSSAQLGLFVAGLALLSRRRRGVVGNDGGRS